MMHATTNPQVSGEGPGEGLIPGRIYFLSRIVIGLALLIAGLDKVTGGQPLLLASRWVIPSAVMVGWGLFECIVGWIAMTFTPRRSLRHLLLLLFATFVVVLSVEWYTGSVQCPCLRGSELPIGYVLMFDLLALASLGVFRRDWDHAPLAAGSAMREVLGNLKYVVPAVLGIAVFLFGSLESTVGYLSGQSLLVTPQEMFLGEIDANEEVQVEVRLRNASSTPLRVLGASASCRCVAVRELPVTVTPWATKTIKIAVYGQEEPGLQRETTTLICDDSASQLTLSVTALVHPNRNAVDANSK